MSDNHEHYLTTWQSMHSGVDPRANYWVRGYLRVIFALSHALNRLKVSPNTFTLTSGGVILGSSLYYLQERSILAVALIAFIGLLLDGIDGSLAILQNRASSFGAVLDSVNDRIQECFLYIAISWILYSDGYSLWIATALLLSLTATLLLEYARSRAQVAVKVTIWERPTRILVISFFVVAASVISDFDAVLLYVMSALALLLSAIGLYQQFQDAKRQLL